MDTVEKMDHNRLAKIAYKVKSKTYGKTKAIMERRIDTDIPSKRMTSEEHTRQF